MRSPQFGTDGSTQPSLSNSERESLKQRILSGISAIRGEEAAAAMPLDGESGAALRTNDSLVQHRSSGNGASGNSVSSPTRGGFGDFGTFNDGFPRGGKDPSLESLESASPMQKRTSKLPMQAFAPFFTFGCIILFFMPIFQVVYLNGDVDVQFWIGSWFGEIAALLPLLFIGSFFVHAKLGKPQKLVVLSCVVVPSMVLLGIGRLLVLGAANAAEDLADSKCGALTEKQTLQDAWLAAKDLLEVCTAAGETSVDRGLQWCSQYEAKREFHKQSWDYLRSAEERHGCRGWCELGQTLWGSEIPAQDSCSNTVARALERKVQRTAAQVELYSLFIMVAACAASLGVFIGHGSGASIQ